MKKRGGKAFLISCIFWLLPGLAAGMVSAAYLSAHEYRAAARLAGAMQEEETLPAVLKRAEEAGSSVENGSLEEKGIYEGDSSIKEKGGLVEKDSLEETGRTFLEKYGYRKYGKLAENLPFTLSVNLLLFEAAGCFVFFYRKKEEEYQVYRIEELTEYLKAVDRGEAAVLTRHEDLFSHLEDEIYKTVAELTCTKEKAVKDHEILADRIADIAHQLKTPLTSMSLMTELLEPAQKEEEEYLDRLKHQVERLRGLVEGLLTLAKLDSHTIEFEKAEIEVEELIAEAAEPLSELMNRRQIALEIRQTLGMPESSGIAEGTEEIWIRADLQWTAEALLNVLKNCVEHTPDGGKIKITCSQNPLYTELLIQDGGNGISKKDLPHLFERFYRGEQASKDSAGIGLALAKLILEAQNGQISAQNSKDGHAQFKIKWYVS